MARKVRLALVGCGRRGRYVTSLFKAHPGCEVTAFVDRYPAIAELAARELELPDAYVGHDFDRMLREAPVDAVFFACDPTEQADLACRAMDAGRHACTEVPAAFTVEDCWKLVHTVQRTGCKYQLMEQTRYWGFIEAWRQMHERGELGHICFAQGEYVHYEEHWNYWVDPQTGEFANSLHPPAGRKMNPTWRYKVLAEPIYYLPHTLSPLLKILGDRVLKVSCMGTRRESYTYPGESLPWTDIQYALMHTAKDTVMAVGAGFSLPCARRAQTGAHWYELRGTKGSVESPRYIRDPFRVWRAGAESCEEMPLSAVPLDADEEQAKTGHGGADFKPIDAFIKAILNDTTPPMDVYRTAEMTAPAVLAAESARQGGGLLDVPDFRATL